MTYCEGIAENESLTHSSRVSKESLGYEISNK